jgi:acetyl esterase/lipase
MRSFNGAIPQSSIHLFSEPTMKNAESIRGRSTKIGIGALVLALLSACSATTALDHFISHDTYIGTAGVPYGPDPRNRLDIYQPVGNPVPAGVPVVLFFYGGNWSRGERADYRFVGEALASNGIIVLVADYRLSPKVDYADILGDSAMALKWTLSHAAEFGGDPARVFLMGHSAGAYNAAMLALDPRWLTAVGLAPNRISGWIGLAGPYDFLPIVDTEVQTAFHWPQTPADSQPINHATLKAPRALLLSGRTDHVVDPQRNTVGLARQLRATGTNVDVRLFSHIDHVGIVAAMARPLDWLAPVLSAVVAFV